MQLAIKTLGCKVNQAEEGELLSLLAPDFELISFENKADCYIINSCSVTQEAESKARQLVRQAKKRNPDAFLILTGCFRPETTSLWQSLGVDLLWPNSKKLMLKEELLKIKATPRKTSSLKKQPKTLKTKIRAFVKIQDGCDCFCSYCLIPHLRPKKISKAVKQVIEEIKQLETGGVKEIVLCGINLGKYGQGLKEKVNLTTLIKAILKETTVPRLRLSSINVEDVTDELINLMENENRVARHLHLPLQSGSDHILKLMRRRYTTSRFLKTISKIKKQMPKIGLTTDLIVGFPSETEADFQQSLTVLKQIQPLKVHLFKFSARPGTLAATLLNPVPEKIKKERLQQAQTLSANLATQYKKQLKNEVLEVLVEQEVNGYQSGYSSEYIKVKFFSLKSLKNQFIKAKGELCL